ncbi:MAG: hypothetical protein ABW178_01750 [Pseudoxanthomonas sp.]
MPHQPLISSALLSLALAACNQGGQPPHAEPTPDQLPPSAERAPPADAPAPATSEPRTPEQEGATS